jgi:DnaJ-class molecular chaperone
VLKKDLLKPDKQLVRSIGMGDVDLYKVLGVKKDSDISEIRKAYKDLSKIHHPDKHGGSEEKFKEISHAHEVLSDPEKRQIYDVTGSADGQVQGGFPFGAGGFPFGFQREGGGIHVDINDLFGNLFGGGRRHQEGPHRKVRRAKGADKTHEMALRLSDFYHGKTVTINLNRQVFCDLCHGDGCSSWKTCDACKGRGVKETMVQMGPGMLAVSSGPCFDCSSEGRVRGKECSECFSKGLVDSLKNITLEIKPGSSPGDILRFEGMCSDHNDFEKPGDLLFRLVEADEEIDIERDGIHLKSFFTIGLSDALLGCKRVIHDHPGYQGEEKLVVDIPAGIQNGEIIRVKGKGFRLEGDLLVTIKVVVSESEKKALETHKAILQSIFINS